MNTSLVEKPWGFYLVLAESYNYKTKLLCIEPNHELSYQSHEHRDEYWVVVEGQGSLILDGDHDVLYRGRQIMIPRMAKHQAINKGLTDLLIIETQIGDKLSEDDIVRYSDKYGRT